MNRAASKHERLHQIEALLLTHPGGLTLSELSERLGVNRSTIWRNLADMDAPIFEEKGKFLIDREHYQFNVHFNLHEALALHLAARLLADNLDRLNPHGAAALRKLGIALETLAPHISRHMLQSADVMEAPSQRKDAHYLKNLEALTTAWAGGHKVKISYESSKQGAATCIFAPYYIEPKGRARYERSRSSGWSMWRY
jgi:predicted DNA-binding transcriptional regulator YafY